MLEGLLVSGEVGFYGPEQDLKLLMFIDLSRIVRQRDECSCRLLLHQLRVSGTLEAVEL